MEYLAAHLVFNKSSIVIIALLLLLILERVFPVVKFRENFKRLFKNFSLSVFNVAIGPLIVIPLSAFAASHTIEWRPVWSQSWIFDVVVLDCWIYFWHRANHRIPLLWRFHEVHHLDERLDATSALRFHFGEVALSSIVRAGVIILLAVPLFSVVIFETLVAVAALFHHSNLRLPRRLEKYLSFIIVTPSLHFVHHHAVQADTDSNYGTVFSFWDRLFGSRSFTQRRKDFKIGVDGQVDVSLLRLILRPFFKA
jgi:sterol desaturase/sphingolipid hydroxylase (fatty acid hydroxylase superfamily)